MKYKIYKIIKFFLSIGVTSIISIFLPLIVYNYFKSTIPASEIGEYFLKFEVILRIEVIIGILISLLVGLKMLYSKFNINYLIFSLIYEILLFIDIIILSNLNIFDIETGNFTFKLNLLVLSVFPSIIPILLIIRTILNFKVIRIEWEEYLVILKSIYINKIIFSSIQLSKFLRSLDLNLDIKSILRQLNRLLQNLVKNELIENSDGYKLTNFGRKILKELENINSYKKILLL